MVVLAGVGLFLVTFGRYAGRTGESKVGAAKWEVSTLEGALGLFQQDTGRYPTTAEGLNALCVQPPGIKEWHGPYLSHVLMNDPWDNPYVYRCPGIRNPRGFDLLSKGSDGREGTRDDVWSLP